MRTPVGVCDDGRMAPNPLVSLSNNLADVIATAAPSIVQVQGRRRPASGLVYASDLVLTLARSLGREEGVRVRRDDGTVLEAEVAGWDPATSVAMLRVPNLGTKPLAPASDAARVGHLAIAIGRSWSNAVSASAGIVSVIGGPLRTGRRRAIDRVIRTTAPMHDGFSGGALLDAAGGLLGITTSTTIRGTTVVIPAEIAWKAAAALAEHGRIKRGYLGVAGLPIRLSGAQRVDDRSSALLVVNVTADSPAATAGVLIGDLILDLDGEPIESPEDLLDRLAGDRVGREVALRILRGGTSQTIPVVVGERPID
jgi:S1-C subfamily serine protease